MEETGRNAGKGQLMLILAAILWGSCFIFQKKGMEYIGPYTLGAFRFIIGGLVLLPVIFLFSKSKKTAVNEEESKPGQKLLWQGGLLCGAALFLAASLQQIGLVYTTAGKAAFLTSMEIVAVEILGFLLIRKLSLNKAAGVALAVLGMYLLCISNGFTMQFGDVLEGIGALFWGVQILLIDKYSKVLDAMKLCFIQFIFAGFLSAIGMFIFEKPGLKAIYACAVPILYTAIVEVAICYTLQAIGQKYVTPVVAAVTLSLEAVFAAIFGAVFLHEALSGREIGGMVLMLLAVIVIQIPVKRMLVWIRK